MPWWNNFMLSLDPYFWYAVHSSYIFLLRKIRYVLVEAGVFWLFNEATLKSTWGMWPQWHAHWRRQWPLLFCLAYHWKCSTLINISLLTEMFRLDLKNVFFKISLIFLLFSFLISLSLSPCMGLCLYVCHLTT